MRWLDEITPAAIWVAIVALLVMSDCEEERSYRACLDLGHAPAECSDAGTGRTGCTFISKGNNE